MKLLNLLKEEVDKKWPLNWHNATSKLVALIFSPFSVLKPKIGCSVCTKNTNACTQANILALF